MTTGSRNFFTKRTYSYENYINQLHSDLHIPTPTIVKKTKNVAQELKKSMGLILLRKKKVLDKKIDYSTELYLCESLEKKVTFDDIGIFHDEINDRHKMLVKLRRDETVRRIE